MTSKVDLTEHGDFAGGVNFDDMSVTEAIQFSIDEILNEDSMTNEQYFYISAYEAIFGKRIHITEKHNVFDRYDISSLHIDTTKCFRCGRPIRAPWRMVYGLCPECRQHEIDEPTESWGEDDMGTLKRNLFGLR